MRKLHTFEQEMDANRFTAVLTVNKVEAQVLRNHEEGWDLWIIDEDAIKNARSLLQTYQADPESPQIQMALAKAKKIQQQLKQEKAERIKRAKKIEVRTQFRDPHSMMAAMQRKNTLTRKIIMLSAFVFGACLVFYHSVQMLEYGCFTPGSIEQFGRTRTFPAKLIHVIHFVIFLP